MWNSEKNYKFDNVRNTLMPKCNWNYKLKLVVDKLSELFVIFFKSPIQNKYEDS